MGNTYEYINHDSHRHVSLDIVKWVIKIRLPTTIFNMSAMVGVVNESLEIFPPIICATSRKTISSHLENVRDKISMIL